MADKSIIVSDSQRAGHAVATRDALEPDASGNARMIQLVDLAGRRLENGLPFRYYISSDMGVDLDSPSQTMLDNLIWVGDCDRVVCQLLHSQAGGSAVVTPVVFDAAGNAVGVLESKASGVATPFTLTEHFGYSQYYASPMLGWPTWGAAGIGLHISQLYPTEWPNGNIVEVFAAALSEAPWPGAVWAPVFNASLGDTPDTDGLNHRFLFTSEHGGNTVRLFMEDMNDAATVDGYIGKASASGDAWDFDPASMAQITWDDGATTAKTLTSAGLWSDEVTMPVTLAAGEQLLVSLYATAGNSIVTYAYGLDGLEAYHKSGVGSSESATADVTGYGTANDTVHWISRIEIKTV